LTAEGRRRTDTDWHLPQLYKFLAEMDVTVLAANYSRLVVDLNRPGDGSTLYPGQVETPLCPAETFSGAPLYGEGMEPGADEVKQRQELYWQPYHDALKNELKRIKKAHGKALLWDAHSINNHVPRLFSGTLPDLNFGTNGGLSCSPEMEQCLAKIAAGQKDYSFVFNGRFKGGAITRTYGQPTQGIEAVQLELSQATYMDQTSPFDFREDLATKVRPLLHQLIGALACG
jgi:N-formylglutamate deformylase